MSRRLILMRHAKSDWAAGAADDHSRPLNARGQREAPAVAARIAELGWSPEVILSSDAERTRQTAAHLLKGLGDPQVTYRPDLYLAGVDQVRAAIRGLDPAVQTVLLLGHNPGWEEAVEWLTGKEEVLKTSSAALLFGADKPWPELVEAKGRFGLDSVLRAKEL